MRHSFSLLIFLLFLASCVKEAGLDETVTESAFSDRSTKVTICHKTGSGTNAWVAIDISTSALQAHLAHGDIIPDEDNDGYTKSNPCGLGSQNDCDDLDGMINPGAAEVCGNGKDDNCNGEIDENCYETVLICGKEWMLKNLNVSKYRNGDIIPQIQDPTEWVNAGENGIGAWCYYGNNSSNGVVYGKLYNWFAVNDPRGLAPEGWHVASDAEIVSLVNCQGGFSTAGNNLKESGTLHWLTNSTTATNSSGFTALPGGARAADGNEYGTLGYTGFWWSSTYPMYIYIHSAGSIVGRFTGPVKAGYSVRCIKDF